VKCGECGKGATGGDVTAGVFLFPLCLSLSLFYLVRFSASLGTPCPFLTKDKEKEERRKRGGRHFLLHPRRDVKSIQNSGGHSFFPLPFSLPCVVAAGKKSRETGTISGGGGQVCIP
jgi:hypothetical protein